MPVSYGRDIRPLFRAIDIGHMGPFGIMLDDVTWMTDPSGQHANAALVFNRLSDKSMPPDAPWPQNQIDLYQRWMNDGYNP